MQLTLLGLPQLPSVQVKVALPVLALSVLFNVMAVPLLAEVFGAAEQLAKPEDQVRGVALEAQGCGAGATQTPLTNVSGRLQVAEADVVRTAKYEKLFTCTVSVLSLFTVTGVIST